MKSPPGVIPNTLDFPVKILENIHTAHILMLNISTSKKYDSKSVKNLIFSEQPHRSSSSIHVLEILVHFS